MKLNFRFKSKNNNTNPALLTTGMIFSVIGIITLIVSITSFINTYKLISNGIETNGNVIEIITNTNREGKTHKTARIEFTDLNNNIIEFVTKTSVDNTLNVGRSIPLIYNPTEPRNAKMRNSFFDMWGLAFVTFVFFLSFGLSGFSLIGSKMLMKRREERAKNYKIIVQANIVDVKHKLRTKVNGVSPYQIIAEANDPTSNEWRTFKSKNIWFDPTPYLTDTITVRIDENKPKRYWMDISFLTNNPNVKN